MYHLQSGLTTSSLLTLFLLLFSFFNLSVARWCNRHDEQVLLKIKTGLGKPKSMVNWNPQYDCCLQWVGIRCNRNGSIIWFDLELSENDTSRVPSAVGHLTSLKFLYIHRPKTNISIPFPLAICNLTSLLDLYIVSPDLSGSIPSCLGRLKNLTRLSIGSSSHMSGPIPKSLGQLTNLTFLDLSSNNVSGPIPDSLGRLRKLDYINLMSNRLSGSIPPSLALITNLTFMTLSDNQLSGSIPKSFGLFKNNIMLVLSGNQLSGAIPMSLSRANASYFDLSNNNLTGDASFLLGRKKGFVKAINLSNNQLKFNFSQVDLAVDLRELNISHNMIYGSFPTSWGPLRLRTMDVSYNRLCGPIPNGKRWKWFNPRYYAHNKCLCGPPLPPCK